MVQSITVQPAALSLDEVLRKVLHSGDALECSLAVEVLAQIGDDYAQELLIECLLSEDPDVRGDAATALGRCNNARVAVALLDNLKNDPCGETKVLYIQALQALGALSCVKTLQVLAQGRGENAGIFWEDDCAGWDDWLDVQCAAIEALGCLGGGEKADATVAAVLFALDDRDGQDLWAIACRALAGLGARGCAALAELLGETSALNRKRIATALGTSAGIEGEALLLQLVQDGDGGVRIAAIESGAVRGLESLRQAGLQNNFPAVRIKTLEVFDTFDRAQFVKALNDVDAGVRIAACQAIEKAARPWTGLGLVPRAKRQLRVSSEKFLVALVGAMAVAEPEQALIFIEEIANHKATNPAVCCAALRALGKFSSTGAVECLALAATDSKQDIRREAIIALGRIAKTRKRAAEKAGAVLACAIRGELVMPPQDWQPPPENHAGQVPKHGARAPRDDGDAKIHLSRDGDVVSGLAPGEESAEMDQDLPAGPPPLSTLEAILSYQPAASEPQASIELDEADMAFLELTGSRGGRRRLNPEALVPAHLDVQRLAVHLAPEAGRPELIAPLASAAVANDNVVCEAALEALGQMAADSIDITTAAPAVLQQSRAADKAVRARAVAALAWITSKEAEAVLVRSAADPCGTIRAAAVAAIAWRGGDAGRLEVLLCDEERRVRQLAAELVSKKGGARAISNLLAYAVFENALDKSDAARLLSRHGSAAHDAVAAWAGGDDNLQRIVGLELLALMLKARNAG